MRPFQIQRFTNMTREDFDKFARAGVPIIVTDITRDWPQREWTCSTMQQRFKGQNMHQAYQGPFDQEAGRPLDHVPMEDGTWATEAKDNDLPPHIVERMKGVGQTVPTKMPYYWGAKDARRWYGAKGEALFAELDKVTAATASAAWQPLTLPPHHQVTTVGYCMAPENRRSMADTPEYWFGVGGAGAKAHMDNHCQSTMSVQLDGTKQWRLGEIPTTHKRTVRRGTYRDGAVYEQAFVRQHLGGRDWDPYYVFELRKGEGLFIPPGTIHETRNVGAGGACAASVREGGGGGLSV